MRSELLRGRLVDRFSIGNLRQPGIGLVQTLQRYAVFYVATSAGWDVFGAIGNAVFILLFGMPTLRTLQRFKGRFTFNYQPVTLSSSSTPTQLSEA